MFTRAELEDVIPLVGECVPPTPQYAWPLLKALTGVDVVVKHENHTRIGAFKVRGGIVYFDRLKRDRPAVKGVITATRGNHGQSLAYAGARAGIAVTIVVPYGNSIEKNAAMRAYGAELIEHGSDFATGQATGQKALHRSREAQDDNRQKCLLLMEAAETAKRR
jgi:threonine dehydratase